MSEPKTLQTAPRVIAVNRSAAKGVPKQSIPSGTFIAGFGLEGDAHAGDWHRQVSLLDWGSFVKMTDRGASGLEPGCFAENITTENIALDALRIGERLRIGAAVLEITQIGKECHQHCAIYQQVGDCVMPREGVFARVLRGGTVFPGDAIIVETK